MSVREVQLLGGGRNENGPGAPSYNSNTQSANSESSANTVPAANEITEPIDDLPF